MKTTNEKQLKYTANLTKMLEAAPHPIPFQLFS